LLSPLADAGNLSAGTLLDGFLSTSVTVLQAPVAAGDSEAQRLLRYVLSQNIDDPAAQARAVELFRSAADAGDRYAALNLARAYAQGRGVAADAVQAAGGHGWLRRPDWSKATAISVTGYRRWITSPRW